MSARCTISLPEDTLAQLPIQRVGGENTAVPQTGSSPADAASCTIPATTGSRDTAATPRDGATATAGAAAAPSAVSRTLVKGGVTPAHPPAPGLTPGSLCPQQPAPGAPSSPASATAAWCSASGGTPGATANATSSTPNSGAADGSRAVGRARARVLRGDRPAPPRAT